MDEQLIKRVIESALDREITDHIGYDKQAPAGRCVRSGTVSENSGLRLGYVGQEAEAATSATSGTRVTRPGQQERV